MQKVDVSQKTKWNKRSEMETDGFNVVLRPLSMKKWRRQMCV